MDRSARGLTLLELLIAMSIFSVLGVFLFTLVGRSLEIYHSAEGQGEFIDSIDQAVTPLVDDLSCVYIGDPGGTGTKAEFLLSHDRRYVPSEEAKTAPPATAYASGDPRSLLLRFVRTYPGGELESTIGRFAGTYADADRYIDGQDDLGESRALDSTRRGERSKQVKRSKTDGTPASMPATGLLPPGDLAEVMYFVEKTPGDEAGNLTLYRAMRSPIGGPGSFFDEKTINAMSPEWIAAHAVPVVSHVAYFAVVLWSQNTDQWETEHALDGMGLRQAKDGSWRGGEIWWDSTRGRYSEFGLTKGAGSLANSEDDVFPSRAQIVVTLAPEGRASGSGVVAGGVAAGAKFVTVSNPQPLRAGASDDRFIRVDDEWMRVTAIDGRSATVVRAARQTTASQHEAGARYVVGRSFSKVIEIPSYRNYFKGPGE